MKTCISAYYGSACGYYSKTNTNSYFFLLCFQADRQRQVLAWLILHISMARFMTLLFAYLRTCNAFLTLITNKAILNIRCIGNRGKSLLGRKQYDSVPYNQFEKQVQKVQRQSFIFISFFFFNLVLFLIYLLVLSQQMYFIYNILFKNAQRMLLLLTYSVTNMRTEE